MAIRATWEAGQSGIATAGPVPDSFRAGVANATADQKAI